jgi:hypothetical protein
VNSRALLGFDKRDSSFECLNDATAFDSRLQWDIVRGKATLVSLFCFTKRDTYRPEMLVSWMAHRRRKYLEKGAFSFAILYIMTSWASLRLFYTTHIIIIWLSQAKTWISNVICRGLLYDQWIELRGGCPFCCYWWNYWLSLFKLSFHKSTWTLQNIMLNGIICFINILDFQLLVQSVSITTKVVSSNPGYVEVYSIQHCVIKFVSALREVCGSLRVLRFPPPVKLTASI